MFISFAYMVNKQLTAECICEIYNCPDDLPVPAREDFENPLVKKAAVYMDLINDPVHPESEGLIFVASIVEMANPDNVVKKRVNYSNLVAIEIHPSI
jgi:hypothetical protein